MAAAPRKFRTVVRRQARKGRRASAKSPFRCWRCKGTLEQHNGSLQCENGDAEHSPRRGVLNLLPPGPDPGGDVFDTWYGRLYDAAVNRRELAVPGGFLMWGADVARVYEAMDEAIECKPGEFVVDVPAGGGVTFARGAAETGGQLVGLDLSAAMLERAAKRRRELRLDTKTVLLARGDATRLPFFDSSVDRICCFNSLHCIPHHAAVLKEFRRVLKPAGELVGTTLVVDAPPPWRLNVELARVGGFFVPPVSAVLARQAKAAGFERWHTKRSGALLYFRGE